MENPFFDDAITPPQIIQRSTLDVFATPSSVGPISIDGGGLLFVNSGGELNCGNLTLGGISRTRPARCRLDESNPALADDVLNVDNIIVGGPRGFPGLLELVTAAVSVDQFFTIDTGSTLSGDGMLVIRNPSGQLTNRGTISVPPGAAKTLQISRDYVQPISGRLVLTVNRLNSAVDAPLALLGDTVQLNDTIVLRFSGNRLPRSGEVFALLRAENATINNNATVRVAGASRRFVVVQDPFGIVVTFH